MFRCSCTISHLSAFHIDVAAHSRLCMCSGCGCRLHQKHELRGCRVLNCPKGCVLYTFIDSLLIFASLGSWPIFVHGASLLALLPHVDVNRSRHRVIQLLALCRTVTHNISPMAALMTATTLTRHVATKLATHHAEHMYCMRGPAEVHV